MNWNKTRINKIMGFSPHRGHNTDSELIISIGSVFFYGKANFFPLLLSANRVTKPHFHVVTPMLRNSHFIGNVAVFCIAQL